MIKKVLQTKLGSALAVAAAVVSIGTVATVSAAHQPPGTGSLAGYTKDQCKNGGWRNFKNPDGSMMFKNQGQCVAFFASGGKGGNSSNNTNNTTQNITTNQNVTSGPADNGAASGNVSASNTNNVSATTTSSTSN